MEPKRRRPRKPSEPLGYISFSKKGEVKKVVERLPDTKEDLEAAIMRKFIGALQNFEGRVLTGLTSAAWPDFEVREGDRRVGVELVEVVDSAQAAIHGVRQAYLRRTLELLDDLLPALSGIDITLNDGYQEQFLYPPLKTSEGKELASFIANSLRTAAPELEALEGRFYARSWRDTPVVGISAYRFAPKNAGIPARIGFSEAVLGYSGKGNILLAQTIAGKVDKKYTFFDGQLWLLTYELAVSWVVESMDGALDVARRILGDGKHPFAEVWYLHPYAEEDLGHLQKLWP